MQDDRPKQMDETEPNISIMDQDAETLEEGDETIQEWKSRYLINGEFFDCFLFIGSSQNKKYCILRNKILKWQ